MTTENGDKQQCYLSQTLLRYLYQMIEERDQEIKELTRKMQDLRYAALYQSIVELEPHRLGD